MKKNLLNNSIYFFLICLKKHQKLSSTRSKSVLKSLRCRSSGRSKSKSKSSVDLNRVLNADNASLASTSNSGYNGGEGQDQVSGSGSWSIS